MRDHPKITHSMLCSGTSAIVEMLKVQPTGECRVASVHTECGRDLEEFSHDEKTPRPKGGRP